MGRWDRRHLWRLTQFLCKNWSALSDDGNKLPALSLWLVRLLILLVIFRAVVCSKVRASSFLLPLLYQVAKFFYKLPTFLSAWANIRKQVCSLPSAFVEMASFANKKARWRKGVNCESFWSVWCWVVGGCLAQSSLFRRSTCFSLSGLSAGQWLVRAHAGPGCGRTKGLVTASQKQIIG